MDARFQSCEQRIEARLCLRVERINARFAAQDTKFADIHANFRVVYWMLGVLGAGVGSLVVKAFG